MSIMDIVSRLRSPAHQPHRNAPSPQSEAPDRGTSQQPSSHADSRVARLTAPIFAPVPVRGELNHILHILRAGTVIGIADTDQIAMDRDVRRLHSGSRRFEPVAGQR